LKTCVKARKNQSTNQLIARLEMKLLRSQFLFIKLKEKEEEKLLEVVETSEVVEMDNYTNTEVCAKKID
jgi:hypothetical protein